MFIYLKAYVYFLGVQVAGLGFLLQLVRHNTSS